MSSRSSDYSGFDSDRDPRNSDHSGFDEDNHGDSDSNSRGFRKKENYRKNYRKNTGNKTHFTVSPMISCQLDFDFAIALGQLLLDVETDDKRFKSFGHNLCNLEE